MELREPHLISEISPGRWVATTIPDRTRWTVGRGATSDLVIDWDGSVSRAQAVIERLGALLVIEDSGFSRNSTLVSGKRILGRTRLSDLDEITCGTCVIHVRLPPAGVADAATIGVGRAASTPARLELTPAERRVAAALRPRATSLDEPAQVPTNRQIAAELEIGIETVKSHLKAITQKLSQGGVRGPIDRARVAEMAASGQLDLPPS